jgi:hypothetical protein
VDVAKARQSLQLATEARAALDKKDLAAAEEKTRLAREAWSENEIATRLEKEVADAKTVASTAPPTETTAEPTPTETKPERTAEEKQAESTATETTDTTTGGAAGDDEPNPLFRIVLIIIIAAVAFVGLKAYRSIRKKSSEVIE